METADFPTPIAAVEFLARHSYQPIPSSVLPVGYAIGADLWTFCEVTQQAACVWQHGSSYRAATWPAYGAPSRAVARALGKAGSGQGARA